MENQLPVAKRVLVVEDNELNLKLFCDLLRAHGFETEPVATLAAPSAITSNAVLNIPADKYATILDPNDGPARPAGARMPRNRMP